MSSISGQLSTFRIGEYSYPFFTSGDLSSTKAVVFVGGLTDGLGSVPYTTRLSAELGKAGWKL
jgi:hypothetical protein